MNSILAKNKPFDDLVRFIRELPVPLRPDEQEFLNEVVSGKWDAPGRDLLIVARAADAKLRESLAAAFWAKPPSPMTNAQYLPTPNKVTGQLTGAAGTAAPARPFPNPAEFQVEFGPHFSKLGSDVFKEREDAIKSIKTAISLSVYSRDQARFHLIRSELTAILKNPPNAESERAARELLNHLGWLALPQ